MLKRDFINIGNLNTDVLLDSVHMYSSDVEHSHRRQQLYAALLNASPGLADVIDLIDSMDQNRTPDGDSRISAGALLALTAIADFSRDANSDYDVRDDAAADYLAELHLEDIGEALEAATEDDAYVAEQRSARQYTYTRDRLAKTYPALIQFIPEMVGNNTGRSDEFRNGMWLGAIQLLTAIDSMVSGNFEHGVRSSEINRMFNEQKDVPGVYE